MSTLLRVPRLARPSTSLVDWWLQIRKGNERGTTKGIDSTVLLVSWRIWKVRNDVVFNRRPPVIDSAMSQIFEDAASWIQAGARHLAELVAGQVVSTSGIVLAL